MKPTQAQIDAAAEAIRKYMGVFTDAEEIAAAALTAAAEMGELLVTPTIVKERCSRCHAVLGDMDKAMTESNRLWRAINCMNEDDFDKRAEMVTHQSFDGLMVGPSNRATIVATLAEHFAQIDEDAKAATIERCARVADEYQVGENEDSVAARIGRRIRALKDKP